MGRAFVRLFYAIPLDLFVLADFTGGMGVGFAVDLRENDNFSMGLTMPLNKVRIRFICLKTSISNCKKRDASDVK